MQRPDLATLACVNPACQQFQHTGQANLTVRQVYGQARIRLLRCRTCGEAFSERRGTAWCNTKIPEEHAASVIDHLGAGCGVRATACLVHVAKDTVARLLLIVIVITSLHPGNTLQDRFKVLANKHPGSIYAIN